MTSIFLWQNLERGGAEIPSFVMFPVCPSMSHLIAVGPSWQGGVTTSLIGYTMCSLGGGIYEPVWRLLGVEGACLLRPCCDACKMDRMSPCALSCCGSRPKKREIPPFSVWRAVIYTSSVLFAAGLCCDSDAFK